MCYRVVRLDILDMLDLVLVLVLVIVSEMVASLGNVRYVRYALGLYIYAWPVIQQSWPYFPLSII